ncbi:MAG: bifunctional DNA-binding transcriptional regulator/O6-methylguanine-DNA methyltransferase Ada [Candidatus Eremiobacteraeota bacterium]|nr:bifunctional DNA-binding transcriptional regulator/O6-methylguanine-DNA methyltransferase Ada [Candidatus Eremiobacteraeota bacterium]
MNALDYRWDAVRDRRADPTFIFAVRTTRIACRPGCPSRTPSHENVLFFDDFAAAKAAGFRACKRCAPDDVAPDADRQRLVARACELLNNANPPSLDDIARAVGLSRFHFQRVFRATMGVTPGEYKRAGRQQRLRTALTRNADVTAAIYDAGYASPSSAYEDRPLGMTPSSFRAGASGEHISYAIAQCSLGSVLVAQTQVGICAIELGDDEDTVIATLRKHFANADLERDDAALRDNLASAIRLIDDPAANVAMNLDVRGTAFQRRVWNALREIPSGTRVTYGAIARAIGSPGAAQAVGAACAANRIAVAVPCHRVVREDGELAGYRWGTARKRNLLEKELTLTER